MVCRTLRAGASKLSGVEHFEKIVRVKGAVQARVPLINGWLRLPMAIWSGGATKRPSRKLPESPHGCRLEPVVTEPLCGCVAPDGGAI